MINCTKHSLEQYARRIKLIDKEDIKSSVAINGEIYEKDLNKMYDNSKIIYKGTFSKKHNCTNFRLVDNIILITDKNDQNIITLYRVDFGFGRNTDKIILDNLLKELNEDEITYTQKKEQVDKEKERLGAEYGQLLLDISAKKKEIISLEEYKKTLEQYIDTYGIDAIEAKEKMDEIARKIVYSIEYRNSLKEIDI